METKQQPTARGTGTEELQNSSTRCGLFFVAGERESIHQKQTNKRGWRCHCLFRARPGRVLESKVLLSLGESVSIGRQRKEVPGSFVIVYWSMVVVAATCWCLPFSWSFG